MWSDLSRFDQLQRQSSLLIACFVHRTPLLQPYRCPRLPLLISTTWMHSVCFAFQSCGVESYRLLHSQQAVGRVSGWADADRYAMHRAVIRTGLRSLCRRTVFPVACQSTLPRSLRAALLSERRRAPLDLIASSYTRLASRWRLAGDRHSCTASVRLGSSVCLSVHASTILSASNNTPKDGSHCIRHSSEPARRPLERDSSAHLSR